MKRLKGAMKMAHTEKIVLRLAALTEQGNRCIYCYEPLTKKTATADHLVPVIKYGLTRRGNIVAACRDCNMAKGSMSAAQFRRVIKSPPPGGPLKFFLARFRRRLWLAEFRASNRIRASVGMDRLKLPKLPPPPSSTG